MQLNGECMFSVDLHGVMTAVTFRGAVSGYDATLCPPGAVSRCDTPL